MTTRTLTKTIVKNTCYLSHDQHNKFLQYISVVINTMIILLISGGSIAHNDYIIDGEVFYQHYCLGGGEILTIYTIWGLNSILEQIVNYPNR